ncbi:MAG: ATP-binding cassette domain-containing protein, partial [Candidatus Latescibacterota bacterium]
MSNEVFRLHQIVKHAGQTFTLDIPHLSIQAGRIYALVGANGSGKTTLLNLLGLLDEPTEGQLFFEGEDVHRTSPALFRARRQMALVSQQPFLFTGTVRYNLEYGLKVRGADRSETRKKALNALKSVGLEEFEKRKVSELSGGESQRVAFARAMCLEPKVLLLDEPTTNVDRRYVAVIEQLIGTIREHNGTTVVLTTHDLAQARRLSDAVFSLVDGRIVERPLENVFSGPVLETNGLKQVAISEHLRLSVITDKVGHVHVGIEPEELILSHLPLDSSARNAFQGRVVEIVEEGVRIRARVA